jgi:hypothetical protein
MSSTVIVNHGFDETNRERKTRHENGAVECPKCGKPVPMESDTAAWIEGDDGRWVHAEFGPAVGWCCNLAIVDDFGGCRAIEVDCDGGDA